MDDPRSDPRPSALLPPSEPAGSAPLPPPPSSRAKAKRAYRATPRLPLPPDGAALVDRIQAAGLLGLSLSAFGARERAGGINAQRYRLSHESNSPILYIESDIERLRDELNTVGQPYPDPAAPGIWRVPLRTLKGYVEAIIDAVDLDKVAGRRWNVIESKAGTGGRRTDRAVVVLANRDRGIIPLKRIILGLEEKGMASLVSHANGDPLDCRRSNLLVRTPSQRSRQIYKRPSYAGRPPTSRYKGVCWTDRPPGWMAQIGHNGKRIRLGVFEGEVEAAEAYDEAAREHFGDEARLNFPIRGEKPTALDVAPSQQPVPAPTPLPPPLPGAYTHTCPRPPRRNAA